MFARKALAGHARVRRMLERTDGEGEKKRKNVGTKERKPYNKRMKIEDGKGRGEEKAEEKIFNGDQAIRPSLSSQHLAASMDGAGASRSAPPNTP